MIVEPKIDEKFLLYKLFNAEGFGSKSIYKILEQISIGNIDLESVFSINESEFVKLFPELGRGRFKRANLKSLKELNEEKLFDEYNELNRNGIHIIPYFDKYYPEQLLDFLEIGIPPIIFAKGSLAILNTESVAIIGSREASAKGKNLARKFSTELAMNGINIVSGYAKGIDTNAHLGALEQDGTTTIVLSYGIFEFSNRKIFDELNWKINTVIVSQFHPKMKWNARNAMIRNKLICALSQAVIVIESGIEKDINGHRSGTFDSAKNALNMNIPLFVVNPGYFDKTPAGNRHLIEIGGIEINPDSAIPVILNNLNNKKETSDKHTKIEQLSLFG